MLFNTTCENRRDFYVLTYVAIGLSWKVEMLGTDRR